MQTPQRHGGQWSSSQNPTRPWSRLYTTATRIIVCRVGMSFSHARYTRRGGSIHLRYLYWNGLEECKGSQTKTAFVVDLMTFDQYFELPTTSEHAAIQRRLPADRYRLPEHSAIRHLGMYRRRAPGIEHIRTRRNAGSQFMCNKLGLSRPRRPF